MKLTAMLSGLVMLPCIVLEKFTMAESGTHIDIIPWWCRIAFVAKSTVANQTIITLRLTPQLAKRLDAWWRSEVEREGGVRVVSRNEVIARLIDAGLVALAKE